jgi:transposase
MFLRKLTVKRKNKKYDYWLLVKSYRVRKTGKVRQKTILHLGKLKPAQVSLVQSLLAAKSPNTFITSWDNIKLKQSVEFLTVGILTRIWRYWELDKFLNEQLPRSKELVNIATVAQILAINRAVAPQSDFKVQSWYKRTILPVFLKTEARHINPTRIYRTLDMILGIEPRLQKYLYEKIKEKGLSEFDLIFYDITSTYFEGIGPSLAERGHPWGHRNNKRQILLALAITKDGFPFYWRVF